MFDRKLDRTIDGKLANKQSTLSANTCEGSPEKPEIANQSSSLFMIWFKTDHDVIQKNITIGRDI